MLDPPFLLKDTVRMRIPFFVGLGLALWVLTLGWFFFQRSQFKVDINGGIFRAKTSAEVALLLNQNAAEAKRQLCFDAVFIILYTGSVIFISTAGRASAHVPAQVLAWIAFALILATAVADVFEDIGWLILTRGNNSLAANYVHVIKALLLYGCAAGFVTAFLSLLVTPNLISRS